MEISKPIEFEGDSLDVIRELPSDAMDSVGYQLDRVQQGKEPNDWKPMATIGPGVKEIRVQEESGAFRVFYVATFPEAIYVLHVFTKKTQQTEKRHIDLAKERFKNLKKDRSKKI